VNTDRLNTLIVDDEAAFRRVLRTSLTQSGFVIDEAQSGEEAVAILSKYSFDLVLLDINMPGMGGVQACREIRAQSQKIGIVMVTVRDGESEMVRALEAGADDYITKPIRFREMVARLRAVVRRLHIDDANEPTLLQAGDLELDINRRLLCRQGEVVHLTPTEFELLAHEESRNSGYAYEIVAFCLGTGIWHRTRLPPLFRQSPAPENRKRSRQTKIHCDRALAWIPVL
jgi:two-component system KDP operon response regulator KdpE